MPFTPKITRARFVLGPFSSEQMAAIGNVMVDTIKTRIQSGLNINDDPAKPLKPGRNGRGGYPGYKSSHGLNPIRDWTLRGRTLGSMKVKAANENRVVIGFTDDKADLIAHINNLRERTFGISPKDRIVLQAAVQATFKQARVVRTMKVA
jgi:hypothetical protein